MKGLLISFEGTDGCGKSTQIRLLSEYLTAQGREVVVSREPGGSNIGEKIREILLSKENDGMANMCELFLYEAARAQHMEETVLPALNAGKIVILDRFIDSTFAYQGVGRDLGEDTVESLNRAAIGGRYPDLTLLLSLPPEKAFKRKGGNDESDRIEMAGDAFFARVQQGFDRAAERHPERIECINVTGTKEETHKLICDRIDRLMEETYGG